MLGKVYKHFLVLQELMNKKDIIGDLFNQLRLQRQRSLARQPAKDNGEDAELEATLGQMLMVMDHLDTLIGAPHPNHVMHPFSGCLSWSSARWSCWWHITRTPPLLSWVLLFRITHLARWCAPH